MGLNKEELRSINTADFGAPSVPVKLRREARLLAREKGITPYAALEIVKQDEQQRLATLRREHKKQIIQLMKKPVKLRRKRTRPQRKGSSSWPEPPPDGVNRKAMVGGDCLV